MSYYLIEHFVITPNQTGFQAGDSTVVNQLLYTCNEISNTLDNNKELRIVFLDTIKAFDGVWHKGLLFKLNPACMGKWVPHGQNQGTMPKLDPCGSHIGILAHVEPT